MKDIALVESLAKLQCSHDVIYDLSVRIRRTEIEIDALVITSKAIFLVDKYELAWKVLHEEKCSFIEKVLVEMGKNIYPIKVEHFITYKRVCPQLDGKYSNCKICSFKMLPEQIAAYPSEEIYNSDKINQISEILANAYFLF